MLIVRTGGDRSGRSSAALSNWKFALDESCTPPPARRQWPVSAGRQAIVRTAMPPPRMPLQAVVHADERGLRPAVPLAERDDRLGGDAGDRADALRRILARALAQLRRCRACAARCSRRPRGPRSNSTCIIPSASAASVPGRMPIHSSHCAAVRVRIGSIAMTVRAVLARLEHERPEVRVRRQRVRSPEQHEIALRNAFGVGADVGADRHPHAHRAGHRADRAVEHRRADGVEEPPVHRRALDHAHRARVRVRQNRLRPVGRRADRVQPRRRSRRAPRPTRSRSNCPAPFGPDAAHRMEQPVAMIGALDVAVDLRAEKARV